LKFKIPNILKSKTAVENMEGQRQFVRIIAQPKPFDPQWPRYCPERAFPPYRHVPGVTPHPIRDPRGHSFGHEDDDELVNLPENWRDVEDYLYGVDLYNFAYWWEAHEAWEGLWNKTEDDCRLFLQGLIQVSAALIKWHMRTLGGIRSLSTAGREKIRQVRHRLEDPRGVYMGIDLNTYLDTTDTFFEPFFSATVSEETYTQISTNPLISLKF